MVTLKKENNALFGLTRHFQPCRVRIVACRLDPSQVLCSAGFALLKHCVKAQKNNLWKTDAVDRAGFEPMGSEPKMNKKPFY